MSTSSQSARFRKVDVDEYDENKFVDEDEGGDSQGGPDEAEVDSLLRQYPFIYSTVLFLVKSLFSHGDGAEYSEDLGFSRRLLLCRC
ncbi:actin-related protein 2/3 complex subunit 5-like [Solea senegalensis]|uniref:Actin-related protein 2/3 complex subunit 5-like n=1 Tax=Solea senegalensis TaxID=28829 RepID=A0AAV6T954_SOLSE|nr:actin-related protein 2/3 complex subunit 5-like [Solea senegalensis]